MRLYGRAVAKKTQNLTPAISSPGIGAEGKPIDSASVDSIPRFLTEYNRVLKSQCKSVIKIWAYPKSSICYGNKSEVSIRTLCAMHYYGDVTRRMNV